MSMNLRFYTVYDSDIDDIIQEPMRLNMLYYGEILDTTALDELEKSEKESIVKWIPKIKSDIFYIGSMFQALHYLLTLETEWGKGAFPLNFLTGQRLDIGEIGWGRATFYRSNDVIQISDTLESLDYEEVEKRFNADFFNEKEIYPKGYKWIASNSKGLLVKLKEITDFINSAKYRNLGMYRVLV